ncbi:MAG: cupin domain-containing protein [Candidatus Omnitrophota bacterium]|jgi:mannose-6-phosphate isomerase-like protein (cupin superfamily)
MNKELKVIKLKGEGKYRRLLGGVPDTQGMKSGYMTLSPGESVGEHSTGQKEEAIIILQGKGEISCEAKTPITAEENTLVYVPPDTKHDVKNTGKEALKYVYVVSPLGSVIN